MIVSHRRLGRYNLVVSRLQVVGKGRCRRYELTLSVDVGRTEEEGRDEYLKGICLRHRWRGDISILLDIQAIGYLIEARCDRNRQTYTAHAPSPVPTSRMV